MSSANIFCIGASALIMSADFFASGLTVGAAAIADKETAERTVNKESIRMRIFLLSLVFSFPFILPLRVFQVFNFSLLYLRFLSFL